ncbi:MAG TPA: glycosyltransferase 87 family protein [Candidatus Nanopelagicales bacterium]
MPTLSRNESGTGTGDVGDLGEADELVLPTHDDPFVAESSEVAGGPAGARVLAGRGWWTPVRVLLLLAIACFSIGYLSKAPCHGSDGFDSGPQYTQVCYSDIAYLYQLRGFADGYLPYVQTDPNGQALEYPVLTGAFMQVASWLTGSDGSVSSRSLRFYDWNVILLGGALLVAVGCTAMTVRRRPWDAALLALAPSVALTSIINWDLLAVALTAGFMLAWARRRPVLAGVLLGLAISAKFYPVLLLGPLLLVCWRSRRWPELWRCTAATAASWLVVNVPVLLANPSGWLTFYKFSADRGEDWGSIWYALTSWGRGIPAQWLNDVALVLLLLCCAVIAVLAWWAPQVPRLAQLSFLVIAAFCLTNKVYSPQYVLWLIPLAALARPRWRDFLIWQAGEVVYFFAIWWFLQGYGNDNKALPQSWYTVAIAIHVACTLYFCVMIARDMLQAERDPVPPDDGAFDDDDAPDDDALDEGAFGGPGSRHSLSGAATPG